MRTEKKTNANKLIALYFLPQIKINSRNKKKNFYQNTLNNLPR